MSETTNEDMVLTQEELEGENSPPNPVDEAIDESTIPENEIEESEEEPEENPDEEPEIISAKYECSFAPMGHSNTVITHKFDGNIYNYKIQMENKIYELPAELLEKGETEEKEAEKALIRKRTRMALLANGFEDVTVLTSKKVFDVKSGKYIYRAIHREQSPKNSINCTLSLALIGDDNRPMFHEDGPKKGLQIFEQVRIEDGIAETDNVLVYKGLLDAGFIELEKKEINE